MQGKEAAQSRLHGSPSVVEEDSHGGGWGEDSQIHVHMLGPWRNLTDAQELIQQHIQHGHRQA